MRGVVARSFGKAKDVLTMVDELAVPALKRGSGEMLIKVHACSVSPGDERMMSGDCIAVKKPKEFPYVPGLDVSGVVVEVDPEVSKKNSCRFRVGDEVVATWEMFGVGGMAEYAIVQMKLAAHKPPRVGFVEAASLCNSATYAMMMVRKVELKKGSRVLILGGSGGLGTSLVQLAKDAGASFIACTSTRRDLMMSLGADYVINYRQENWWDDIALIKNPLDVIFDCAEGLEAWHHVRSHTILKSGRNGGTFVAFIWNQWRVVMNRCHEVPGHVVPALWRCVTSHLEPEFPRYMIGYCGGMAEASSLEDLMGIAEEGRIRAILDHSSPHPFTEDGVKSAFSLLEQRGAQGKIVVNIAGN